jgi:hypothetical protein
MYRSILGVIIGYILLIATSVSFADQVTYSFTGSVKMLGSKLAPYFSTGDAVTGSFTFDTETAPDAGFKEFLQARYYTNELLITINDNHYNFPSTCMTVDNDAYETRGSYQSGYTDGVSIWSRSNETEDSSLLGYERVSGGLIFGSQNNTLLNDASIPDLISVYPGSDYMSEGRISFSEGNSGPFLRFSITSIKKE